MRIKNICLEWFRGAANEVCFDPESKSVVVYGPNGSGKSCFVDSVEYLTNDGRIGHLAHEYSGKKQEKAILNTQIPDDKQAKILIKLSDGSQQEAVIDKKGTCSHGDSPADDLRGWTYRRTVLRQDEVSNFIKEPKASKYSALLPLLGLESMENAAENLRVLVKKVESESNLREKKGAIIEGDRRKAEAESEKSLADQVDEIYELYSDDPIPVEFGKKVTQLSTAIQERVQASTAEQRRHILLQQTAALDPTGAAERVRTLSERLIQSVEPQIEERIGILENVSAFIEKIEDESVSCPACGQWVATDDFRAHVEREENRLRELSLLVAERRTLISQFCDVLKSLQSYLRKDELSGWRDGVDLPEIEAILDFEVETLRTTWSEESLVEVLSSAQIIVDAAKTEEANAPIDLEKLVADQRKAELCLDVLRIDKLRTEVQTIDNLTRFLNETEQSIRNQIRVQAMAIIEAISADIQRYWSILHPDVPISEVCLHVPETDKAIDIHLKFYGKDQDSPRLTLSEGYRNSLGLCIFLAMAKFEAEADRPIILDDVVVSLDRNHRGMIAELLEKEFYEFQVLLFTHDRDWYAELGHFLPRANWEFRVLLPWDKPEVGIRWSTKTTTFEEARALLDTRADAAGNDARKIMDTELALVAEKLKISMPYLRGEKNDRRMARDFITKIVSAAKKCLERKDEGNTWKKDTEALTTLEAAEMGLLAWGNRASHSYDVVKSEATKLIDSCEAALEVFKCKSCPKHLWYANAGGPEVVQCECGEIRWRYGKDE